MLKSAFDPDTGSWHINWPERVSRHDLVYLTPPEDPLQGIPLGNGDAGVLSWFEESKTIFVVNKCDLWDDAIIRMQTGVGHVYTIVPDMGTMDD